MGFGQEDFNRTSSLQQKRDDIARHENLCENPDRHNRLLLGSELNSDPAEGHIYRRSEQRRREEDEQGLSDVRANGCGVEMRWDASDIPAAFNCIRRPGQSAFRQRRGLISQNKPTRNGMKK
jgi:hypothetical protein